MTRTVVESKTKSVIIGFDQPFCVIGERINPTGRKRLAAELEAGDFSTVESDAIAQVLAGANILDKWREGVREEATGSIKQAKQLDPNKQLSGLASLGKIDA